MWIWVVACIHSGAMILSIYGEKHRKQTLLPFEKNEIWDHLPHKYCGSQAEQNESKSNRGNMRHSDVPHRIRIKCLVDCCNPHISQKLGESHMHSSSCRLSTFPFRYNPT